MLIFKRKSNLSKRKKEKSDITWSGEGWP